MLQRSNGLQRSPANDANLRESDFMRNIEGIKHPNVQMESAVILSRVDDEGPPKRSKITQAKNSFHRQYCLVEREAIDRITHAHDLDHTLDPAEES